MKTPGEYLHDLRVGTDFLDSTQKALVIKEKFDILDKIKNRSVFQSKVAINWVNTDKSQKISAIHGEQNHALFQDIHILIPGTCQYVTSYFYVIKLWILKWGDYLGLSIMDTM